MRNYDAPIEAALEADGIVKRGMILFSFPSGSYGFWDDAGERTYNSVVYKPGAQLIEIDTGEQSLEMASNAVTLKLRANGELTSSVLLTIENEDYHQRPVTIMKALFDPDTRALINVWPVWYGKVDRVEHQRDGEDYAIVGYCESRSIDYSRRGTALSSDAQQQALSSGDVGLKYCGYGFDQMQVAFGTETPATFRGGGVGTGRPVL